MGNEYLVVLAGLIILTGIIASVAQIDAKPRETTKHS